MMIRKDARSFMLVASVMLLASVSFVCMAEPASVKMVFPGKEISVAPVRPELPGEPLRQSADSRTIRVPTEGGLAVRGYRGHVTIVSSSGPYVRQAAGPVPVDEAAISRACEVILAANRDKELRCEPNVIFSVMRVPDDSRYSSLYGLKKMRLPQVWDRALGSRDIIAAVVDTGVDYTHDDLERNIVVNTREIENNGIDDDANGYIDDVRGYDFVDDDPNPMDLNGHGTHCAGVIGGEGNNGRGVVGVNWSVGLLPIRALTREGSGAASDVAAGIVFAVKRGASVINLSLGGREFSRVVEDAIQYALDHDVLVVAAAGNRGADNDAVPIYPASSGKANVIAVAASTSGDILASFSNYGIESVDVAAPGEGILSTVPGNRYAVYDGTSMAAPHVTGLAALLRSLSPSRSSADIRNVILGTVALRAGMRDKISTGGRVDALAAVEALAPPPTPTVTPTPVPGQSQPTATPTPRSPGGGGVAPGPTPTPTKGNGGGEVARLTLRAVVKSRTATLFGNAFSSQDLGLGAQAISLNCAGKRMGDATSLNDGSYLFKVKRTKQAQRCTSSAANGVTSPPVRIRKR